MQAKRKNRSYRIMLLAGLGWLWISTAGLWGSLSAEEITNTLGMKFRLLEAGRFEMGERELSLGFYKDHSEFNIDDERPVHPVVLTRPLYLATMEVTVGQFRRFVQDTGYQTSAEKSERGAVGWDPKPPADNPRYLGTFRDGKEFHWKQPGFLQAENHPVVGVSFHDAKAFCEWLSKKEGIPYRLPTEAEWEYAARAGTRTYFSFGDAYRGTIHRYANIGNVELEKAFPDRVRRQWLVDVERDPEDQHLFTAPVGSYEPNPWGLFDLYGNVWEWCEDRYLDTAYAPYARAGHQQVRKRAIDPLNLEKWGDAGDWRVIRGGSWFNAPIQCRSGVRGYFEVNEAACYLGFRVARDASEQILAAVRSRFERTEAARKAITEIVQQNNVQERRDGRLTLLLRREHLTEEFFTALKVLDEPVDLYLYGEGRLTGKDIVPLAQAPKLTGLLLSNAGAELLDQDFAFLADHPQLELLQITGTPKLTDGVFQHLRKHDRLELLHLDAPGITDEGLKMLPALGRLESLQLAGTGSEGLVLERFRHSPMRTFSCGKLTDMGANSLEHFTDLGELTLAGSPITGPSLKVISQLPRLERLVLTNCQGLRDQDFAVLGNLYELRSLILQQTAAGDAAATAIVRLNNLNDLYIGSEHLSDAGLHRICEIVSLTYLTLHKEADRVTDAGLADLWRLVNLRNLSIEAPKITGSGLATLAELATLEGLQLGGAGMQDVALKHAASSKCLKRIFLGQWQWGGPAGVTDMGLLHLANSRSLTQFDFLRQNTQITDQGLDQLRKRRPQLSVDAK